MAASIGAEVAGLAADKLNRGGRRIITGTSERSGHLLKYSSDKRLWVSPPGGKTITMAILGH